MRTSDEAEDAAKVLARIFDLASRAWPIAHTESEEIKFEYYNRKDNVRAVGMPQGHSRQLTMLCGVRKYFGAVHALRNVKLSVGRNETGTDPQSWTYAFHCCELSTTTCRDKHSIEASGSSAGRRACRYSRPMAIVTLPPRKTVRRVALQVQLTHDLFALRISERRRGA